MKTMSPPIRPFAHSLLSHHMYISHTYNSHLNISIRKTVTMGVGDLLKLANVFPDVLNQEILVKISFFLQFAPRFKDDILLTQASGWPASEPPLFLPESVNILLSRLCDIDKESTDSLWSYLRDRVWDYAERAKVVDDRLKLHGKDLGFSAFNFQHPFSGYTNLFYQPLCIHP